MGEIVEFMIYTERREKSPFDSFGFGAILEKLTMGKVTKYIVVQFHVYYYQCYHACKYFNFAQVPLNTIS